MADSLTSTLQSLVAQVRASQQAPLGLEQADAEPARVLIGKVLQAGQDAKNSLRNGYGM